MALLPGVPIIQLLVGVQVLNGVLLPIVLIFILVLSSDSHLTCSLRNGRLGHTLGWGTFVLVTAAVVVLLANQV